jgi:signal transduction histidine kinase
VSLARRARTRRRLPAVVRVRARSAPYPGPAAADRTITITAGLDPAGQTITWTVSDTGIGIPPAEPPRLFRRFYRASTAVDQRIPGTGLGLVVTRTIIERHHGTIAVTDHTHHNRPGSTFTIELPTKPPPA